MVVLTDVDTLPVPHALNDTVDVPQALPVGDRVEEGHTVGVPDTLVDPVEDKHREAVGLTLGLLD